MADIFDELTSKSGTQEDIFSKLAEKQPSRTRSLVSSVPKGALKEAVDLTSLFRILPGIGGSSGPIPPELQKQLIERFLPTQENPLEKGLERAGRLGVQAIGGGEGLLPKAIRTGLGAIGGQALEEAGAPEWAQSLAELAAFTSPKFGKKVLPKKSQKEMVDFLRQKGFSEKQIAPLIRSENFLSKTLSTFSQKGKKTETLGKSISSKLGESYDLLKKSGESKYLPNEKVAKFDDELLGVIDKINPRFSRLIEKDLETLRNKGYSQKNLIDFYQDINSIVGKQEGGKAVIGVLKKPIIKGLQEIDPQAAKEFSSINQFYAKGQKVLKNLKPSTLEKLLKGGKNLAVLGSVATLNFSFLPKIIGAHAAQLVSRELLINPRLQNLSLQMLESISANKIPAALKTLEIFQKELRKNNPEAADSIDKILRQQKS